MPEKLILTCDSSKNSIFTDNLLSWGRSNGRKNLPWTPKKGDKYDPYKVWISEIMLQQTQLVTGINFFKKFMLTFPTVEVLALSKLEKVLISWAGLGYYARAKNLHNAAQMICLKQKNVFPNSAEEWMKLPGVGFSTAASISAFVTNEKVAVMDANVIRVIARQFKLKDFVGSTRLKNKILPLATKFLPHSSTNMPIYTQSIMDLGAIICRPHNPKCYLCPVSSSCSSFATDQMLNYPVRRKSSIKEKKVMKWLIPYTKDSTALVLSKNSKLWPGLWTPIQILTESQIPKEAYFFKKLKTPISNFILEVSIWCVFCTDKKLYNSVKWFKREELATSPVPSTVKKALYLI